MTTTNESREAMEPVAEVSGGKGNTIYATALVKVPTLEIGDKLYTAAQLATVEARVRELEAERDAIYGKWRTTCEQTDARIAELDALSVTNILVAVVPGEDGMGEEVYAKSVAEIEGELTKLSEKCEYKQERIASLESALAAAKGGGEITDAEQRESQA